MERALIALLLVTLPGPAPAQAETSCSVSANLLDQDPAGTNVRSGPGGSFAALGRLPTDRTDLIEIIAAKGSWVKIAKAVDEEGETIIGRQGWVYAPLLGMTVSWNPDDPKKAGHHYLYAGPSGKSRVLGRVAPEATVTLESCQGKWVKVKQHGRTGWLAPEAQCTNTRTTCS
jgi:SH3-like domain-containing protein